MVKLATEKSTGDEYACKIMALPAVNARATDSENTRWAERWLGLGLAGPETLCVHLHAANEKTRTWGEPVHKLVCGQQVLRYCRCALLLFVCCDGNALLLFVWL